jgi:hypothetical protein
VARNSAVHTPGDDTTNVYGNFPDAGRVFRHRDLVEHGHLVRVEPGDRDGRPGQRVEGQFDGVADVHDCAHTVLLTDAPELPAVTCDVAPPALITDSSPPVLATQCG